MRQIKVGLIGFGTVGSGTAKVMVEQAERLKRKTGADIILKTVADLRTETLPDHLAGVALVKDAAALIGDPEIDVVVELIGGIEPARTFILDAIGAGKHVVTANKALISQHGKEIFEAAAVRNVEVGFEASVGGGIPVIKALKEGLAANRINTIMGIMNGTANYILHRMTNEGVGFAEVLRDAQELGFAEADPTYDIDGIDTAHKLVILMSMAYGINARLDEVSIEGISAIEPIDIEFAREFGYRIKLLAISVNHGDHVEARVHPAMVPEEHMLANISGAYNGIHFNGDMVGNVLFYGLGAGQVPTGSAVVADIVDISRNILHDSINRVPPLSYRPDELRPSAITPMEKISSPHYFRIPVKDRPGVLSKISGILAAHDISIESVIQKGRDDTGVVPVVIRTYEASDAAVGAAMAEIEALDACAGTIVKIRILANELSE